MAPLHIGELHSQASPDEKRKPPKNGIILFLGDVFGPGTLDGLRIISEGSNRRHCSAEGHY